jgi:hypothetical protein
MLGARAAAITYEIRSARVLQVLPLVGAGHDP